jgi:hypothetical protein
MAASPPVDKRNLHLTFQVSVEVESVPKLVF